jgi:predicted amidohydrolase
LKAKRVLVWVPATLATVIGAYAAWGFLGRVNEQSRFATQAHLGDYATYGEDRGRGNLVGVEPWMEAGDYGHAGRFHAKLDLYMRAAADRGWLRREKTVVVFPEYIGTWLVAAREKQDVYRAASTKQALTVIVLSNPVAFWRARKASRERDRNAAAVFRMKADGIAADYDATFRRLAGEYGVTIVAGSVVLPEPSAVAGRLKAGKGPLYNVSAVYGPDGRVLGMSRKAHPTADEKPFIAAAPVEELPAFETAAGRLGVIICADSWFPAAYASLRKGRPAFLAVPSFAGDGEAWNKPWGGYSGQAPPGDVDSADVGRLTEKEAWAKYALPGRIAASGARAGLDVFMRGDLWEFRPQAQTIIVRNGKATMRTLGTGCPGALINVWL